MSTEHDYVPKPLDENAKRYPPRRRLDVTPAGQDFQTLTERHGRPFGPFDKERKLPYRGGMK